MEAKVQQNPRFVEEVFRDFQGRSASLIKSSHFCTECQMVMNVLWTRLGETGKDWRYVYKALTVIEYLIANGADSFQVDKVAYHLSVLKDLFPVGINVLSLFSGIEGADLALHRLGIRFKTVVFVEKSKVNRDIVRVWWEQTNQKGILIDTDDVQKLTGDRSEQLISRYGRFDLHIGGSSGNNLAVSNRVSCDELEGK